MANEKKFPPLLKCWKYEIERIGKKHGLSFPTVIYEMVENQTMWELGAYSGFPVRYHHWSFGQDYLDMVNSGRMGARYYELIINTDPCYGFLLEENPLDIQKLVMAHAGCGHADFFQNNSYCRIAIKSMHNKFADHAAVIEEFRTLYGKERVDVFLEACMSLDTMIDLMRAFIDRFPLPAKETADERPQWQPQKIRPHEDLPFYMDRILNTDEFLNTQRAHFEEEERRQIDIERGIKIPASPVRDVLWFLILYAPLEKWQKAILYIVWVEQLFLYTAAQTKVMNEGWASLWHYEILVKDGVVADAELYPFAKTHAGVLGSGGMNPYQLGFALWKHIWFKWDTHRHGDIYENCQISSIKNRWDEFAVCKSLIDQFGVRTLEFWNAWDAFSFMLNEIAEGRGDYPSEYFTPDQIIPAWLRYEDPQHLFERYSAQLDRVIAFEEIVRKRLDALMEERVDVAFSRDSMRFQAWHDCWIMCNEDSDLLWTSEDLKKELRRFELFRSIRERFHETEDKKRIQISEEWFWWAEKHSDPIMLGKGQEKIFEVRRTHSDASFIEEFFDQDFCDSQQYFTYGIEHDRYVPDIGMTDVYVIRSRNFRRIKESLLNWVLNCGLPQVEIIDANYNNNKELLVCHLHDGRDLDRNDLMDVMRRLWIVWGGQKTVHFETVETVWPAKRSWWETWRPPGYPSVPPQEIKYKKVRYSCMNGKEVTNQYF